MLSELTDEQLLTDAIQAIKDAAQGEANGGDNETYVRAVQFKVESDKRLVASGHEKRCRSGIYSQAYEVATALHSGREPETFTCDCRAAHA